MPHRKFARIKRENMSAKNCLHKMDFDVRVGNHVGNSIMPTSTFIQVTTVVAKRT